MWRNAGTDVFLVSPSTVASSANKTVHASDHKSFRKTLYKPENPGAIVADAGITGKRPLY